MWWISKHKNFIVLSGGDKVTPEFLIQNNYFHPCYVKLQYENLPKCICDLQDGQCVEIEFIKNPWHKSPKSNKDKNVFIPTDGAEVVFYVANENTFDPEGYLHPGYYHGIYKCSDKKISIKPVFNIKNYGNTSFFNSSKWAYVEDIINMLQLK